MSIGNSIGDSIGLSIGQSIGELGIVPDTLAHFDETTILGTNPVTEWRNKGRGASPFDLDTVVGTAANLTTLDTGVALLTGTAGDFFSTPDSAAASITGDIDIRWRIAMTDNTPAATQSSVGKIETNTTRSYFTTMRTSGKILFTTSTDGTAGNSVVGESTVATGFADGTTHWYRVTLDVDDGAGNRVYKFYTSDESVLDSADVTWVQLGDTVTTAGTTSIFDSNSIVEIGSILAGTTDVLEGKAYRVQIFDGIDGTLAVDFDPSKATVNTATFVSDTGETWTANGDAFVNATGHTGIYSRGSAVLETSAGVDITTQRTIFAVFKPTLAAPSVIGTLFHARSNLTKETQLFTREISNDRYTLSQGTQLILAEAYDNDLRLFTCQLNGDATSKLTVSDVGSVIGDAGAENWDFGSVFGNQAGVTTIQGLFLEFIIYDRALSDAEITQNQNFLEAKYGT